MIIVLITIDSVIIDLPCTLRLEGPVLSPLQLQKYWPSSALTKWWMVSVDSLCSAVKVQREEDKQPDVSAGPVHSSPWQLTKRQSMETGLGATSFWVGGSTIRSEPTVITKIDLAIINAGNSCIYLCDSIVSRKDAK